MTDEEINARNGRPRIALVACGASKGPARARAKDLYTGTLFRHQRAYAEKRCDAWYILSARHGLLAPDTEIEPYEQSLTAMRERERDEWGHQVVARLISAWGHATITPVILAGTAYLGAIVPQLRGLPYRQDVSVAWNKPELPLVRLAIGLQMQWLKGQVTP